MTKITKTNEFTLNGEPFPVYPYNKEEKYGVAYRVIKNLPKLDKVAELVNPNIGYKIIVRKFPRDYNVELRTLDDEPVHKGYACPITKKEAIKAIEDLLRKAYTDYNSNALLCDRRVIYT